MATLKEVLQAIEMLSEEDRTTLNRLLSRQNTPKENLAEYTENCRFAGGRVCPHCGSHQIVRNGHRPDGKQRFVCRKCKKSFVINTNSITSGTHKDIDTWRTYIDCMLNGFSVRKSAETCNINKSTSLCGGTKYLTRCKICKRTFC